MAKTKANVVNLKHVHRDRGYRFVDRDPELDEVCRLITRDGRSAYELSERIKTLSKGIASVAPATLDRWLNGKTKRPQNFTLSWTYLVLGYERRLVKI